MVENLKIIRNSIFFLENLFAGPDRSYWHAGAGLHTFKRHKGWKPDNVSEEKVESTKTLV